MNCVGWVVRVDGVDGKQQGSALPGPLYTLPVVSLAQGVSSRGERLEQAQAKVLGGSPACESALARSPFPSISKLSFDDMAQTSWYPVSPPGCLLWIALKKVEVRARRAGCHGRLGSRRQASSDDALDLHQHLSDSKLLIFLPSQTHSFVLVGPGLLACCTTPVQDVDLYLASAGIPRLLPRPARSPLPSLLA